MPIRRNTCSPLAATLRMTSFTVEGAIPTWASADPLR